MKKLFLLTIVISLLTSCSMIHRKNKAKAEEPIEIEAESLVEQISEEINIDPNRVYSCAYDGFVNMREQPSFKAPKIGQFRNGPQGATLVEDLGEWVKINIGGLVGYVPSKFVQHTPTIAYTGNVSVDWLEAHWGVGDGLLVFNNGYWEYWANNYCPYIRGYYIMQNNEVKFTAVCWFNTGNDICRWEKCDYESTDFIGTLQIDEMNGKLGEYEKIDFLTGKESKEELEEYGGSVEFTKEEFRMEGRDAAKCVEEFLQR